MTNYYFKYLKYKSKYINLQNNFKQQCYTEGYKQQLGECWNDSIQTILTFTKPFEIVQKNAIILNNDGTYIDSKYVVNNTFKNNLRNHLIPLHIVSESDKIEFKSLIIPYINKLLQRFKTVHNKYDPQFKTRIVNDKDEKNLSITCAINALQFSEINKVIKKNITREYSGHGGRIYHELITINSLSYIFLNNNQFINFDIYADDILYGIEKNINESIHNIDKYFAIQLGTLDHAFNVYKCADNFYYFYDDNNENSNKFNWINYFLKEILYYELEIKYSLKENLDNKDWNYYYIIGNHDIFLCTIPNCLKEKIYESKLGYYNEKTNKVLIIKNNESNIYELFNYSELKIIMCQKLESMIGLFVDIAVDRNEYKNKLKNLIYYLYLNNYDIPEVKLYMENEFKTYMKNIENNMFLLIDIINNAFIIEDNNIIQIFYKNTEFFIEHDIDYFDFINAFRNIKQYTTFIYNFVNNFNEDNRNIFIEETIIITKVITNDNKYLALEIFKKFYSKKFPSFKIYINKKFRNFLFFYIKNENNTIDNTTRNLLKLEFIKYIFINNISDIKTRKFEYDTGKDIYFLYFLLISINENIEKLIIDIIMYLKTNWDPEYKIYFEDVDFEGDSILYNIFKIKSEEYFNVIISNLFEMQQNKIIEIFNKKNIKGETFLCYNIQNLSLKSLNLLMDIITTYYNTSYKNKKSIRNEIIKGIKCQKKYLTNNSQNNTQRVRITTFIKYLDKLIKKNEINNNYN